MTETGRVCGESLSRAPSRIACSTPRSWQSPMISAQKERQRMFGSIPRSRTTSRPASGGRASRRRVVGQTMFRCLPSPISTNGRVTWKS